MSIYYGKTKVAGDGGGTTAGVEKIIAGDNVVIEPSNGIGNVKISCPGSSGGITLNDVYPVGSIYIGLQETCPLETLMTGSVWEKIEGGRSIWTKEDDQELGELVNGVLPKHIHLYRKPSDYENCENIKTTQVSTISTGYDDIDTAAQEPFTSNPFIWNDVNKNITTGRTLRAPSLVVNIWKRTA